ncbi:hypothetical protein BDV95DRAFT_390416 [Massariosphaeria phaeospora]|uniref:Uncharacterized protein n=1 Tax=Massariosphaeria phaeospora TaxID=100035 RepID=A0A7C8I7G4_9PLEO|nr:hypothetical protein BDV95DRAFT_390416 [Massariosphaeria phaeospora]
MLVRYQLALDLVPWRTKPIRCNESRSDTYLPRPHLCPLHLGFLNATNYITMKSYSSTINLPRASSIFNTLQRTQIWHCQRPSVHWAMSTLAAPVLRKQRDDGSEEELPEEDLYRYTRYRWLCNEPENLAMRYCKFDLSALLDAAVNAVGHGARSCRTLSVAV